MELLTCKSRWKQSSLKWFETYIKNSCILEPGQRGKHEAIACEEVCSFSQMEFDKIVCLGVCRSICTTEQFTIFRTKFTNEYEA